MTHTLNIEVYFEEYEYDDEDFVTVYINRRSLYQAHKDFDSFCENLKVQTSTTPLLKAQDVIVLDGVVLE